MESLAHVTQVCGIPGLNKTTKQLIMTKPTVVVALADDVELPTAIRVVNALRELCPADNGRHPICISGDEIRKFRKATSLFNGIESFCCAISDFAQGLLFVAPISIPTPSALMCSSWNDEKLHSALHESQEGCVKWLRSFIQAVESGKTRKAKQGADALSVPRPIASQNLQQLVLETFATTVFDNPSVNSLVVLVTSSCPVCPVTLAFLESFFSALAMCGSDRACSCCTTLAGYVYNVAENDLIFQEKASSTSVSQQQDISRVPLVRLFRAGRAEDPVDYSGPREYTPFIDFLKQWLLPQCHNFPFGRLANRLGAVADEDCFSCSGVVCTLLPHAKRQRSLV
jgi:hypothetical protein